MTVTGAQCAYRILIFPVFPQLSFFHVRVDDKQALLLYMLRNVVKIHEQTVVFVATKHHVEYLKEVRYKQQSYLYFRVCSLKQPSFKPSALIYASFFVLFFLISSC